jgi:hypothetical protein
MRSEVRSSLSDACSHCSGRRVLAAGLLLVCAFRPVRVAADERTSFDATELSVVTFGRGDHVNEYFGHNAFVLAGPNLPRPVVVNYGMFSFSPGMIQQFLRGRLSFWVGTTDLELTVDAYRASARDVRVRDLNLEPAVVARVLEQLEHDLRPQNRVYLYDHYFDNCSTRLRDVLDRALGGQLRHAWSRPGKFTLREETLRYTQHDPVVAWSMMFGLNDRVDHRLSEWGEAFLPDELERLLDTTSYVDSHGARVPLVKHRRLLFDAGREPVPAEPTRGWPVLLLVGMLIGVCASALGSRMLHGGQSLHRIGYAAVTALVGIGAGVYGTLLVTLWAFSDHLVAHHNENLLLANPLSLLAGLGSLMLIAPSGRGAQLMCWSWRILAGSSLLLLFAQLCFASFDQDIRWSAALLAPINIGFAFASERVWRNSQQRAVARLAPAPAASGDAQTD